MNYHDRFFKLRHFINNVCSQGRTVNFIIINVSTVLNKGISRISKYPLFFFKALTTKRKLSAGDETLAGEFGGYTKNRKLLFGNLCFTSKSMIS